MLPTDIIAKKRDGHALSQDEIKFFIEGFTTGEIPDYQAAAWAMAVYLRGMNAEETTALTLAMAHSGEVLDLTPIFPRVLDKHSSGGVGDKTTLIVAPLVASLGLPVGKMSGRGLGFSGGTLDKLEAIPGFRCDLNTDEFIAQLKTHGIVVSGQTHDLAPADGKLYALRDVTGAVASLPLIASSIMSKKIAAGAHIIVLDVKVGSGAFMKTVEEAVALAELMVQIGKRVGRKVCAVIGDMNQPLGRAVGNSLEVIEAIETLKGRGPRDLVEHCLEIAAQMVSLADAARDESDARQQAERALADGRALTKFGEWIDAQGGSEQLGDEYTDRPRVLDDYMVLPRAHVIADVLAPRDGYIAAINTEELGLTVVGLGGGRIKKGAPIDYGVGMVMHPKLGARVQRGEPLLTLHAHDRASFEIAEARLLAAYTFSDAPPTLPPGVHRIVR